MMTEEHISNNTRGSLTQSLVSALLTGDTQSVGVILDTYLNKGSLESLYVDILGNTQYKMGELWTQGIISKAQEYRAAQILLDHLTRIRQNTTARKPLGLKAVVSCLPGDQHFLGGRIASDLLILDGWEVHFLGGDVPVEDIIKLCVELDADLVGISIYDQNLINPANEFIKQLKNTLPKIITMIGGRGVMKSEDAKRAEADVVVTEGTQAVAEARRIVGVGGSNNSLYQILGEIGGRINQHRKAQKMSQEKLAKGSGLDRAYISSVENGKQNITIGALLKLADALGVSLSDLVNGSVAKTN